MFGAMTVGLLGVTLSVTSCTEIQCADGTIERNGKCEAADNNVTDAKCGPGTKLDAGHCVPILTPTKCDPGTTLPDTDPVTGVVTCIGTGGGSCTSSLACPAAGPGKMTICGRITEAETSALLQASNPTRAECPAGNAATAGPCALQINAYDAIAFATNPSTATPLPAASVFIDDCGRYKIVDITLGGASFIGVGLDDRTGLGPTGLTVTTGAAVPAAAGTAIKELDLYSVKGSTIGTWTSSAALPSSILAGGVYMSVFRSGATGLGLAPGVTMTRAGAAIPNDDFYFGANDAGRTMLDTAANVTGVNGTALTLRASSLMGHGATGGIPVTCAWESKVGGNVPGVVLVQTRRPANATGQTCPL
jgi:hypothetical protein